MANHRLPALVTLLMVSNLAFSAPATKVERDKVNVMVNLFGGYASAAKEILKGLKDKGADEMKADQSIATTCYLTCMVGQESAFSLSRVISLEQEPQAKDADFMKKLETIRGEIAARLRSSSVEGAAAMKTLGAEAKDQGLRDRIGLLFKVEENVIRFLDESRWIPRTEAKDDVPHL